MSNTRDQFQSDLGNPNVNPMSDTLKLLFEHMDKEMEMNKQFDKEDGIDVDAPDYTPDSSMTRIILTFENYRRAYTETMYHDTLVKLKIVEKNAITSHDLDAKQRSAHNAALRSVLQLKNISKVLKLDPLYKGSEVSKESINGMDSDHSEARKEMTDFFLKLISELSDYNVREIENKYLRENAQTVKDKIRKDDHDFKVKDGGLSEYHGEIKFEDEDNLQI